MSNSRFRHPTKTESWRRSARELRITADNILTDCVVCGKEFPIVQPDASYQAERWRGVCSEECAVDHWQRLGVQGNGSVTAKFRSATSDANARQLDGHEQTTTAAISAATQERRNKVAELFRHGLDKCAIAAALNVPITKVRSDFLILQLTPRTRNLDRTRAYELADAGTPWRQAATQVGISHSQFCQWMKQAGRTPPKRKSKLHLRPQAFAMYDQGKSWDEICSTIGIASCTLSTWLRSRGRNEAKQPAAMEY